MQLFSSPHIYLAAPLFSDAERGYNSRIRDLLTEMGYNIYLPQEQGEDVRQRTIMDDRAVFERHVHALDRVHAVVAICDGPDADSGTAWEAGYAYAKGIPVIVLRTDHRMIGPGRRVNLMLEQSSHIEVTLEDLISHLSTMFLKDQSSEG